MKHALKNKEYIIGLIFVIIAFCIHAQFSFCQSDESNYLAMTYRLYQGDKLIMEEWHPTQFYTPILLPFFALYAFLVPSLNGIILYFRVISILFAGAVSSLWYLHFREKYGFFLSFLTALMLLLFSRANINGPSYYNLCMRFIILSFMLWNSKKSQNAPKLRFLSGMSIAFAVLCMPWLAIPVVAVFIIFLLNRNVDRRNTIQAGMGIVVTAALYIVFFLMRGSLLDYVENLKYVVTDSQHVYTVSALLRRLLKGHYNSNSVPVVFAVLSLSAYVIWKRKERPSDSFWRVQIAVCLLSLVKPLIRISVIPCYAFFGSFAISLFPCMLWAALRREWSDSVKLYFIGIIVAACFAVGSNTGFDAMLTGYCISAAAGLFYISADGLQFRIGNKKSLSFQKVAVYIAVVIVLVAGVQRTFGFYRDSRISRLTVRLTDGPAAGLLTSEENADQYNHLVQIYKDESVFSDGNAFVLHSKCVPWAYLCRENRVGSPTTWAVRISDPRTEYYLRSRNIDDLYICIYSEEVSSYQSCYFNNHKETRNYNAQTLEGVFYNRITKEEPHYQDQYVKVYHLKE